MSNWSYSYERWILKLIIILIFLNLICKIGLITVAVCNEKILDNINTNIFNILKMRVTI